MSVGTAVRQRQSRLDGPARMGKVINRIRKPTGKVYLSGSCTSTRLDNNLNINHTHMGMSFRRLCLNNATENGNMI